MNLNTQPNYTIIKDSKPTAKARIKALDQMLLDFTIRTISEVLAMPKQTKGISPTKRSEGVEADQLTQMVFDHAMTELKDDRIGRDAFHVQFQDLFVRSAMSLIHMGGLSTKKKGDKVFYSAGVRSGMLK